MFLSETCESETQNSCLTFYALGTQFFLYALGYKSLRNLRVYFLWLIISVSHLCLYFLLKENSSIIFFHSNRVTGLRNTIILIILFQLLRYISLRTQNQELVCISKNKTDIFDKRKTTNVDTILYIIYIAVTLSLLSISG